MPARKYETFEEWKAAVDRLLADKLGGLITDDLPDMDYYNMWEAGDSPSMGAREAIRNAKES